MFYQWFGGGGLGCDDVRIVRIVPGRAGTSVQDSGCDESHTSHRFDEFRWVYERFVRAAVDDSGTENLWDRRRPRFGPWRADWSCDLSTRCLHVFYEFVYKDIGAWSFR